MAARGNRGLSNRAAKAVAWVDGVLVWEYIRGQAGSGPESQKCACLDQPSLVEHLQ